MARVGILGGTFNPPHVAHLVCACEALQQLDLERVELVPVGNAPHKDVIGDPGARVRADLCAALVDGFPGLGVNELEVARPGPSFTVDTLRELNDRAPGDQLTFIVGGDMAHALPTWREPEAVLALAALGVAERAEVRREEILERLRSIAHEESRIRFFAMPRLDVSSTLVRARLARGLDVAHLVGPAVARRIAEHGVYA